MTRSKQFGSAISTLTCGILWILGACWFVYQLYGNPLDELALIRRAQIAAGSLVDTLEDEQEDSRGKVYFSDIGVYVFRLPEGREFKTTTRVPTGELEELQEVEYLPDDPAVSRIKGDGSQSVVEWLWRNVLLGSIVLAMAVSPGFVLVRHAILEIKGIQKTRPLERKA